jgi:uncharacterized protein
MRTIGAISDTHGLLRPQALAVLAGCDPIIHAGDIGSPDVLAKLGALAPVHAVRGNVDHGAWSANLPVTQRIEIDGFRIYVLHILADLNPQAADNVDAVIYGHSHQPKIETKNGTLSFVERAPQRLLTCRRCLGRLLPFCHRHVRFDRVCDEAILMCSVMHLIEFFCTGSSVAAPRDLRA